MRIIAGMATLDDRTEGCKAALASLLPQVDLVCVGNGTGIGDQVKFGILSTLEPDDVLLTVDDDLVYPPDYVKTMLAGLERHPGAIVSCHGWKIASNGGNAENHRCLETVAGDHSVDVLGTGVMALHPRDLPPGGVVFDRANVADLLMAVACQRHGIARWVLGHEEGWLGYSKPPTTIWDETARATGHPLDASVARRELIDELRRLVHFFKFDGFQPV